MNLLSTYNSQSRVPDGSGRHTLIRDLPFKIMISKQQEELREKCLPLFFVNSISDCIQLLDKFISAYLEIVLKHNYDPVSTQAEADSRIAFQMFVTKALSIKKILQGVEFDNGANHLNRIIDPTILITLIRNMFEALCAFELIYVLPNSADKKLVAHNLYQIAGMKYRQRFTYDGMKPEHKLLLDSEKKDIEECIKEIKDTALYKAFDSKNRSMIENAIKNKSFQIFIDKDNKVKQYGWGDISPLFGVKLSFLKNIYTYFSLNAHPSYISILQFKDMFKKDNPEFVQLAVTGMKSCFVFLSICLADYIRVFPQVMKTYESFSIEDQILLNFHNRLARGEEYSISDKWKLLD